MQRLVMTPLLRKLDATVSGRYPRPESTNLQSPSTLQSSDHQLSDLQSTNPQSTILIPRLLGFLRGSWGWVALSVLLGVLTIGSNVGLMGTSAFLISAAALHPELGTLEVAIVGVRFFGIARGVFRYAERLSFPQRDLPPAGAPAHLVLPGAGAAGPGPPDAVPLRRPARPDRCRMWTPGEFLRAGGFPRRWWRSLIAAGMTVFFGRYAAGLAWTYLAFMLLLGLGVPLLAWCASAAVCRRAADLPAGRPAGPPGGWHPGSGRSAGLWAWTGLFAASAGGWKSLRRHPAAPGCPDRTFQRA